MEAVDPQWRRLHFDKDIILASKMGHTLLALVYMAFGAAAQSTAGAYEQCKIYECLIRLTKLLADLFKVEEPAIRGRLLAGLGTSALSTSEDHQVDG